MEREKLGGSLPGGRHWSWVVTLVGSVWGLASYADSIPAASEHSFWKHMTPYVLLVCAVVWLEVRWQLQERGHLKVVRAIKGARAEHDALVQRLKDHNLYDMAVVLPTEPPPDTDRRIEDLAKTSAKSAVATMLEEIRAEATRGAAAAEREEQKLIAQRHEAVKVALQQCATSARSAAKDCEEDTRVESAWRCSALSLQRFLRSEKARQLGEAITADRGNNEAVALRSRAQAIEEIVRTLPPFEVRDDFRPEDAAWRMEAIR